MQILGLGAMIAGGLSKDKDDRQTAADIGKSIITGNDTITLRSILSYRQVQESAADQAGIAYLTASKQSGRGMLKTFERFAEQELFSDRLKDPYVRSHPMAQSRIAQLRELAERSPYIDATDSAELQLRHDLVRAKLVGYTDGLKRTYNRYPESDQSLPAQYARAIASVENSGADDAVPRIEALIAQKPDFPYFHELLGDVYLKSGRPKEAVAHYRKAAETAAQPESHPHLAGAVDHRRRRWQPHRRGDRHAEEGAGRRRQSDWLPPVGDRLFTKG